MRIDLAPGQTLIRPEADVSDLTKSVRNGAPRWDGRTLVLPFSPEPSAAEQVLIRRRLMTRDLDHEAWVAACVDELATMTANTSPTRLLRLVAAELLRGVDSP